MAGARVATGLHKDGHDVEVEADGPLGGGLNHLYGNGLLQVAVGDPKLGLPVLDRIECVVLPLGGTFFEEGIV